MFLLFIPKLIQGLIITIVIISLMVISTRAMSQTKGKLKSKIYVQSLSFELLIQKRLKELNVKRVKKDDDTLSGRVAAQRIDERMDELELLLKRITKIKKQHHV